jgi:hypothetical protein
MAQRKAYIDPSAPYTVVEGVVTPTAEVPNVYYHPVFGLQPATANNNNVTYSAEGAKMLYNDMAMRASGLANKITTNNRMLTGLANPKAYLAGKNKALSDLKDILGAEYNSHLNTFLEAGYSADEAKKKADEHIKKFTELKVKAIDELYPSTITKDAIDVLKKGGN